MSKLKDLSNITFNITFYEQSKLDELVETKDAWAKGYLQIFLSCRLQRGLIKFSFGMHKVGNVGI